MKKKTRLILFAAVAILLIAATITGWAAYSLNHMTFLTPSQANDVQVAIKGTLGQVVFGEVRPLAENTQTVNGTGLQNMLRQPKEPRGEGLIATYQHDPQLFKRYAELFDTATKAEAIGKAVQAEQATFHFPMSSSELHSQSLEKLDAWGHPYCINAFNTSVVVVSGGPNAASLTCPALHSVEQQIASAKRNIFQAQTGEVVVVLKPREVAPNGHSTN